MSEKKGLMSSKVLNMKFMRAAEIKEEEKKVEEKVLKLKDLSEWKTKDAETLKSKTQARPKIVSVGYSNLNALQQTSAPIGRRVFGEDPKKEQKELEKQEEEENEIEKAFRLEKEEKSGNKRYMSLGIPKKNKKRKSSHE